MSFKKSTNAKFKPSLSKFNIFSNPLVFPVVINSIVLEFVEFLSDCFGSSSKFPKKLNLNSNFGSPRENPEDWFRTSQYGGICLNVNKLYQDNIRHYDVDIKVEYLKNLTISTDLKYNITGKIIVISNFGVVDGQSLYLKEQDNKKKSILLYEFKDVYPYFYDASDNDYRLKNILKLNLPKFSPFLCG